MRAWRARLAKLLGTTLTLALGFTLLVAPTAQAGWTDSGPGGSSGGSGSSGSQGGSNQFHCGNWLPGQNAGALYYKMASSWYRYYEYGYQSCVGQGASSQWLKTGRADLCPAGFLVYRFYGSANNPAAAVTRSQTNLTNWCAPESTYAFPAVNPLDAGVAVGSPWTAQVGVSSSQLNNGALSVHYARNDAGLLVPTWATRVAGNCAALQSESSLRTWYDQVASPTEQIALRAVLGADYWQASEGGAYQASGLAEAGLRYASGYRFNWAAWKTNTNAVPAYDPNGDSYYLTAFDWEQRSCASPFQFMSTTTMPQADRTVFGTCYIPTLRLREQVVHARTGQLSALWPTVQHDNRLGYGDGERLSQYYRGASYTPSGPGGDSLDASTTGLGASQQDALIKGWRNAMVADYRAWAAQGITNAQGAQVVPVNPYAAESDPSKMSQSTVVDINAAADALYQGARCRVGSSVQFDLPEVHDAPAIDAAVNLAMSNVDVLQVSPTEAQIRINAGALLCDSAACPSTVSLKSLSWDATLSGAAGYSLCTATSTQNIPTGCDGVVTSSAVTTSGIQRSQVFTVRFANPTEPREAVEVNLTNLKGTFTQTILTSGLQVRGISPISGRSYTIDTGPLEAKITKDLRVSASGTPTALTPSAGGYLASFPVIGAVQVPVQTS